MPYKYSLQCQSLVSSLAEVDASLGSLKYRYVTELNFGRVKISIAIFLLVKLNNCINHAKVKHLLTSSSETLNSDRLKLPFPNSFLPHSVSRKVSDSIEPPKLQTF